MLPEGLLPRVCLKEIFLDLEPQHDVQIVGHFVGIYSNRDDLYGVDCTVKALRIHRCQLCREHLAILRFPMLPEWTASGDLVLPQSALGFMDAHAGIDTQCRALPLCRSPCSYMPCPASCMDEKKGIQWVVLEEARCHADILSGARAKWMDRAVDAAVIEIESKLSDNFLEEGLLRIGRETFELGRISGFGCLDL